MSTKKILILTTSYGDGHIKTATSVSNEIKKQNPSVEVRIINLFHEAHPIINKIIKYLYLKCYSRVPKIYGLLYYSTKDIRRNFYINNLIGMFGKNTLRKYLKDLKPNIVINTFPVLAMPIHYKKGKTNIPCYTIITDYGIHSQWIDPGVEKYFVAHESLKKQMIEQGVDENRVEVTGIPVYLDNKELNRVKFINNYGLRENNLPIVTVLAGANGVLRNLNETCTKLYSMKPEAQFVIVCGKNKSLQQNVKKATEQYRDRIKVFGFVDNLHEVMTFSDIVVSKAGGITTTEALDLGVPMVVYGTPAGQEQENTKFLIKNNCSYHAKKLNELIKILAQLLGDRSMLENMKNNMKAIAKPNNCNNIVKSILQDIYNKESKPDTTENEANSSCIKS